MRAFPRSQVLIILPILASAMVVLAGCQHTTVEANHASAEMPDAAASEVPAGVVEVVREVPETRPMVVEAPPAASRPAPAPAPRPVYASRSVSSPAPVTAAPALLTVPARTLLSVELDKTLSSHSSQVGETFRSFLVQEVAVDGYTALPRHSIVVGRVTEAKPAKKVGGRARLSLEFHSLLLPDGRQLPIDVVFAEAGKSSTARDAAIIGGSTLGGAVLGRAVDKGEGTAIGAIVGGLAGAAVAHETRAKPVVVNSGTVLTLELLQPLTVELQR